MQSQSQTWLSDWTTRPYITSLSPHQLPHSLSLDPAMMLSLPDPREHAHLCFRTLHSLLSLEWSQGIHRAPPPTAKSFTSLLKQNCFKSSSLMAMLKTPRSLPHLSISLFPLLCSFFLIELTVLEYFASRYMYYLLSIASIRMNACVCVYLCVFSCPVVSESLRPHRL